MPENTYAPLATTADDIDCLHCQKGKLKKKHNSLSVAICDICRQKLPPESFCCDECNKDICGDCQEQKLLAQEQNCVEVIADIKFDDKRTYAKGAVGKIMGITEDKDKQKQYRIRFNTCCCCHTEVYAKSQDFKYLRLVDEPKFNAKVIGAATIIVCLFIYGIVNGKQCNNRLEDVIDWCKTIGLWAPVLIFTICSILPVIMLPVFPMMALSGPLFTEMYDKNALIGGSVAFAAVFGGLWLGSVIAFALGKTVLKRIAESAGEKSTLLKRVNRIIDTGGVRIVLMARALPLLPAEIFDYACALTTLTVTQYAIGCIGSSVPVAFWTYSSAQASLAAQAHSSQNGQTTHHLILIAINVVSLVLLTLMLVCTLRNMEQVQEEGGVGTLTSNSEGGQFLRRSWADTEMANMSNANCCIPETEVEGEIINAETAPT